MKNIIKLSIALVVTFSISVVAAPKSYGQDNIYSIIQKLNTCQSDDDSIKVIQNIIPIGRQGEPADLVLNMAKYGHVSQLKEDMIKGLKGKAGISPDQSVIFIDLAPIKKQEISTLRLYGGGPIILGGILFAIILRSPYPLLACVIGSAMNKYVLIENTLFLTLDSDNPSKPFFIKIENISEEQHKELTDLFRKDYENYMTQAAAADSVGPVEEVY
jgi:hypothetical protein